MARNKSISFAQALWGSIDTSDPDADWLSMRANHGGRVAYSLLAVKAHRLAWLLTYGDIPDGMDVLHSCDMGNCVNPHHLRLGTHADNMADKRLRKRQPHGEQAYNAKLTDAAVAEIRRRWATKPTPHTGVSNKELAAEFGVSKSRISMIVNGKNWTHVS
jgi:HNH endonuclease